MKKALYLPIQLLVILLLFSCTEQLTPEESLKAYVASFTNAVNKRKMSRMRKGVSDNYNDGSSRTKKEILQIISSYFLRNKSFSVSTRIDSIFLSNDNLSAKMIVYAAISNVDFSSNDFQILQAEIHRFDIEVESESEQWKLITATWQQASVDDFLDN